MHSDGRPWDDQNDLYTYESDFIIRTKTKHKTPMVRTQSIVSVSDEAGGGGAGGGTSNAASPGNTITGTGGVSIVDSAAGRRGSAEIRSNKGLILNNIHYFYVNSNPMLILSLRTHPKKAAGCSQRQS